MNFAKATFVFLMLAAIAAAVPAASAATCSNASISGVYGAISSGLNGSSQPAAGITQITADGNGNVTGTQIKSIDGTIVTYNVTGTYQIRSNCTGTATWTNQDSETEHDNIYLNNGNKGAFLIQTDAVHVQAGSAVAQGTVTCTNAAVKHSYSMEFTGFTSSGQSAMAGELTFNGTGSIAGTATLSLDGTIENALHVTGTYSIGSNCMGTAQITPKGLPTINLALIVVSSGKEMLAVETDSGTIVSGTLQE